MNRFLIFIFILTFAVTAFAQTVNVTFNINASTVNDYRWADSTAVVQVRGGIWRDGAESHNQDILKWGVDSKVFTNVGGDYWTATVAFPDSFIGDRIDWKVGATLTNLDGTTTDFWEDHGDRGKFPLPDHDTTLAMAYVSADAPPYTPSDSIDVYFRVNMQVPTETGDFNPDTNPLMLSMVGAFPGPDGADNMWNPGHYQLMRNGTGDFWSFHLKLDPTKAPFDSVMYRFHNNGTDWGGMSENVQGHGMFPDNENRGVSIGTNDTTIVWHWWNDVPAVGFTGQDTIDISFTADMTKAIENHGFVPGDTVVVRMGYENSAEKIYETMPLELAGIGNTYGADTTIVAEVGTELYYSYYLIKFGNDQKETFYDFTSPVTGPSAERRRVDITSKTVTVNDNETDISSLRRQPVFPNTALTQDTTTVVFTCDLRPAYYQVMAGSTLDDIQTSFDIEPADLDSIMTWGVRINGPATGDWASWGINLDEDTTRTMYDDGTHGDEVAGDSIFSITIGYPAGTTKGREFKFGVRGGDNEGGYGNNHVENIDDSDEIIYVRSQFGSIDPLFYSAWDYGNQTPTAIEEVDNYIPEEFSLNQNYPNPFNPVTNITFNLPKTAKVNLIVYNILGQKIKTLVNGTIKAGVHSYKWSGLNDNGIRMPSGIYFYRITADNHSDIKKMVLVK
ncbi:MAG: T9SS type A sorting domain-containing protein [Calditrichaceae bacterium]